jgi:hypothetical protein
MRTIAGLVRIVVVKVKLLEGRQIFDGLHRVVHLLAPSVCGSVFVVAGHNEQHHGPSD